MPAPSHPTGRNLAGLLALSLALLLSAAGCSGSGGGSPPPGDIPDPVFADPVEKIARTGDVDGFSRTLYDQYVHQDPWLVDSSVSPEIHMAFFGGPNNRGRALAYLDTTNWAGRQAGRTPAKAIWIMGNGDWQYAAYRQANESERWTDRASQESVTPPTDQVRLHGQVYVDPFPVTWDQNNAIWANYSVAYASMAKLFHGGGRTVRARFFVTDDSGGTVVWAGRSSAVWTECRTVQRLVADGHVADMKCAAKSFPRHDAPGDWVDCPSTCAPP